MKVDRINYNYLLEIITFKRVDVKQIKYSFMYIKEIIHLPLIAFYE
jgi:hypothetical protein